ncbi:IS66 family transposase [Shigella sonnei]|uniref:IS66 family transposase n=13 Tax=Shigella sonnei TaxID=624 RepID=UPI003C6F3B90
MDTSLAHENARLRALLQTQQDTIRQMAKYNRLLSQRVAAYASEINRLKALVAKLQRMQFGKSSEKLRAKTERQIQEAQERISALQEEMAETLGEQYDPVLPSPLRQSSAHKPLPASLPRETRVIRPEEECCPACGGELSSLGCDVLEQLELISSAFKVIETQRPKLACCRCDHIVQAPVPSKPIARSYAGAGLLAHVVAGKYADYLPLYRQSEIYRRQGVELSRATLGRWTGAVAELLEPLYDILRQYVLMPGKVHADDIPVPVQEPGSGKTRTARLWVYVRDDRNAGSEMPPAVWFAYSPDRKGIHPQNHLAGYSGVLQADAYGSYRALYESGRITEAQQRIGELYAIEAEVRGCSAEQRLAARKARAAPLMQSLYDWIQQQMKIHSLKMECLHGEHYIHREIVRATVFSYIECDYNRWRLQVS